MMFRKRIFLLLAVVLLAWSASAQRVSWSPDGKAMYQVEKNELVSYALPGNERTVVISAQQLTPSGHKSPLKLDHYQFSADGKKALIYTNSQKVWRINTRGDYWVLDFASNSLKQVGKARPEASLMFAKFSSDATQVAYVSEHNIFVEEIATGKTSALTTDGNRKFINGTFDWVYEEEFACRDGIRWSPDNKMVAFWQIDARDTKDFYMIDNTDSIYSQVIPVEYPKVGQSPSACKVGVIEVATKKVTWMNVPGDPRQHYIVRMEFIPGTSNLLIQQLNRKQNESKLMVLNTTNGAATAMWSEKDDAWVDIYTPASAENAYEVDFKHNVEWLGGGKEILWTSEKDGWRHLYRLSVDGKKETLITPGNYDVIALKHIDEKKGYVYYLASPDNATQKYLYRTRLDGKGKMERLSPATQAGSHNYSVAPSGLWAHHRFSNTFTRPVSEMISLPDHKPLDASKSIDGQLAKAQGPKRVEFFKVTTEDGVTMDGWMVKPGNFDENKKYPVVFYVYTEPWGANVTDSYGVGSNPLYQGKMADDGYIYISLDNRGTPAPKGAAWRKAIYRKIGIVNIRDQALGAKEILKWKFVDPERIAVWGWSGGGSATLNLMFQFPDIYKTGIAVAAVGNQLTYDNIYQERYMGLPQENYDDFVKGSPITYAKNLQGKLLYIHGTGDDNVHYQNAEMLLNELIKYNKQFQFMPYPNRTHSISEGEGTFEHLSTLYTNFLRTNCAPGGR